MKFSQLALVCLVFGLVACGDKSKSNSKAPANPPKEKKEVPQEYLKTADLNLANTLSELMTVKSNAVTLKGTGAKSTYKIIYKFNSGNNNSFKVIENILSSKYANCSAPQTEMYLKGNDVAREISVISQIDVKPNSDYTVEVIASHSCEDLDMTFDLLAWVGNSTVDPKLAAICEGQNILQVTFVMNVNFITAYSSLIGNEKFLAMDAYCGEKFVGSETTCNGSASSIFTEGNFSSYSHMQCASKKGSESRTFMVDFDSESKGAAVTCLSGEQVVYAENFGNCRPVVVDYNKYSKF